MLHQVIQWNVNSLLNPQFYNSSRKPRDYVRNKKEN